MARLWSAGGGVALRLALRPSEGAPVTDSVTDTLTDSVTADDVSLCVSLSESLTDAEHMFDFVRSCEVLVLLRVLLVRFRVGKVGAFIGCQPVTKWNVLRMVSLTRVHAVHSTYYLISALGLEIEACCWNI